MPGTDTAPMKTDGHSFLCGIYIRVGGEDRETYKM